MTEERTSKEWVDEESLRLFAEWLGMNYGKKVFGDHLEHHARRIFSHATCVIESRRTALEPQPASIDHLAVLRALLVRERRWLASDPGEEDRTEAVAALEHAIQQLGTAHEPGVSESTGDFDKDLARLDDIRTMHRAARPDLHPDNPGAQIAWENTHRDRGFLLGFIDNLWREYSRVNAKLGAEQPPATVLRAELGDCSEPGSFAARMDTFNRISRAAQPPGETLAKQMVYFATAGVLRDAERYRALRRGNDYERVGAMVVLCEQQHIDSDDRPFWVIVDGLLDQHADAAVAALTKSEQL